MAVQTPAQKAIADKAAADKAAKAAQKLVDDRNAAIKKVKTALPQLANPGAFVDSNNVVNMLGAEKEYLKTNLGFGQEEFKKTAKAYDIATANKAYAIKSLGLDYTKFKGSNYDIKLANQALQYKNKGVNNAEDYIFQKNKYNTIEADKAAYEVPKIIVPKEKPTSFTKAVVNYSDFLSQAQKVGVTNLNAKDQQALRDAARSVRDFDSKNLSADAKEIITSITNGTDLIDQLNNKNSEIVQQKILATGKNSEGKPVSALIKSGAAQKTVTLQEEARSLTNQINQGAPRLVESLSRFGLSDIGINAGNAPSGGGGGAGGGAGGAAVGDASGLSAANQLTTGIADIRSVGEPTTGLAGKLNVEVTDDQILGNINSQIKTKAKDLFDLGTAASVDIQSQITQANQFLTDLPAGDKGKVDAQKIIDKLNTELLSVQNDTAAAKSIYDGNSPINKTNQDTVIAEFRESLRLPEERTIKQIETIDPTVGATVRALSKEYQAMAETPLGATTTAQTEAFRSNLEKGFSDYSGAPIGATTTTETEALRRRIEGEAMSQLALGSQLGAEEQRQYQQAARGAQSARGNIFGIAPAVEEAVTTGRAGEERKLARYGAASQFLSSGETTGAALARDTQLRQALQQDRLGAGAQFLASGETTGAATARDLGLRNALTQSRLGAAQGFIASGPTMYNMASQRLGQQESMLNNYLAASQPQQTGGFQSTPSAANPYAYVNPNAGFMGAQNAAGIFNTLANYQEGVYGSQVGAISRQPSGAQQFGAIASGISGFIPSFSFSK